MRAQVACCVLGLWLMASPAVLDYGRPAATSAWIAGPIVASVAFLAAFRITRGLRWLNVPAGAWLLAAPVLGGGWVAGVGSVLVGAALLALAPLGRPRDDRYAGGWRSLL